MDLFEIRFGLISAGITEPMIYSQRKFVSSRNVAPYERVQNLYTNPFSSDFQLNPIRLDIRPVYLGRESRGGLKLLTCERRHNMNKNIPFWRAVRIAAILAVLVSLFGTSSASAVAARDRKPPTKPANLRAMSLTSYNVTLAWDPSTDNSGTFTYRLFVSWGSTTTLPQTQTTYRVLGLVPNNTYSFYVYAVDGSGNISQRSNTVTVTTPPDTTPPTAPVVSLVAVNPTEVSLQWTSHTLPGLCERQSERRGDLERISSICPWAYSSNVLPDHRPG
jgi:hypothetical protein